jgi:FSR family fosmidomycin resistance protein-like MFS transporter
LSVSSSLASPTDRVEHRSVRVERTAFTVLAAVSVSHLLNDTIQSVLPAIYPLLKSSFALTFAQIGLLTLALNLTASLLQPLVGLYTDRRPAPYALAVGMTFSLAGLLLLSVAWTFGVLVLAAGLIGVGSSVFHPESSRVARLAAGRRPGLAQSLFQVGGNAGSAIGPLVAAFLIAPFGQRSIAWCSLLALSGLALVVRVGRWSRSRMTPRVTAPMPVLTAAGTTLPASKVASSIAILAALIFSKYFYMASLSSYYTFYLISRFHVSVRAAQVHLFVFLAAVAAGTILGGPIGDRFGRKPVIWASILGVLPFTLLLPHANLFWTQILSAVIGLILASAFSAIVVYAQDLMPHRIGLISGVFFGFAFGMGGLGAAALGALADVVGIEAVYSWCAYLPAIGLLAAFLPNLQRPSPPAPGTPASAAS